MVILGINAYHADSSAAIFVDGQMIAAIEEERFRRIKEVHVAPNSFLSNELTITVSERSSYARWCVPSTLEEEARCFAMDENGYVFAPLENQATSTFVTPYIFQGALATSTNSYATLLPIGGMFAAGHFPALITLLQSLGQAGFGALVVTIENGQDIRIDLLQGYYIKASYGTNPGSLVKDFKLVLSSEVLKKDIEKLEYVDLRFGNKVYYKLIGEAASQ